MTLEDAYALDEQETFNRHFAGWCPVDGRFCQERAGCSNCQVKKESVMADKVISVIYYNPSIDYNSVIDKLRCVLAQSQGKIISITIKEAE